MVWLNKVKVVNTLATRRWHADREYSMFTGDARQRALGRIQEINQVARDLGVFDELEAELDMRWEARYEDIRNDALAGLE